MLCIGVSHTLFFLFCVVLCFVFSVFILPYPLPFRCLFFLLSLSPSCVVLALSDVEMKVLLLFTQRIGFHFW